MPAMKTILLALVLTVFLALLVGCGPCYDPARPGDEAKAQAACNGAGANLYRHYSASKEYVKAICDDGSELYLRRSK